MPSQRISAEIAEGQKRKKGGPQPGSGRPKGVKGVRLSPVTRERIRGGMLIARLEKIAEGKARDAEPHHVTAALGLLKFCLPTLAATDLTSGGEPITVERVAFKPTTEKTK